MATPVNRLRVRAWNRSAPRLLRLRRAAVSAGLVLVAAAQPASVAAATHSVSGTITDVHGAGVGGIVVSVCPLVPAPGKLVIVCVGSGATSGGDGAYTATGVPPGTYEVAFRDPSGRHPYAYYSDTGFTPVPTNETDVTVAGSNVTGIDVRYPALHTISGRVTDAHGSPVESADVVAFLPLDDPGNTRISTGADGAYALAVVTGTYTVRASDPDNRFVPVDYSTAGPGGAPTSFYVSADVSGIDIVFPESNHIGGVLHVAATVNGSLASLDIYACPKGAGADWSRCFASESSGGRYRIAVTPGRYQLYFVDFDGGVLPSYWSVRGPVAKPSAATFVDATAGDVTSVSLSLTGIAAGVHAGTSHAGSFPGRALTVAHGSLVTLRFGLGRGFAGARITLEKAVAGSSGRLGSFRSVGTRVVGAGGYVYYATRANGRVAFRALYVASGAPGEALSAQLKILGR